MTSSNAALSLSFKSHGASATQKCGFRLSLVGERIFVAGNSSGEEFYPASLAGAGRGGENLKKFLARGGLARNLRKFCLAGADLFFARGRASHAGARVALSGSKAFGRGFQCYGEFFTA